MLFNKSHPVDVKYLLLNVGHRGLAWGCSSKIKVVIPFTHFNPWFPKVHCISNTHVHLHEKLFGMNLRICSTYKCSATEPTTCRNAVRLCLSSDLMEAGVVWYSWKYLFCRIPPTLHNQLRRNKRQMVMLALESCRKILNWHL